MSVYKFQKCFSLIIIVFSICTSAVANSSIIDLEKIKSSVEFLTIGNPGFLKIRGKNGTLSGKISITVKPEALNLSGVFKVQLDQFDTGIKLRNRHMKEKYLEIKKFPTADLEVKNLLIPWRPTVSDVQTVGFFGKITVHGVSKPISGNLDIKKSNSSSISIKSELGVKISDFGIEIPSFMGVTAADDVTINVSAEFDMKKLNKGRKD